MEPLPSSELIHTENLNKPVLKKQPHFDDKRRKHRNADSKYRSKVQYLYFKIKSLIKKKTAKDGLLDNALGFIHNLETKIYEALGPDYMDNCRNEFLSFLEKEEELWKKEKDVTKWWSSVEDLLRKNLPLDLSGNELTIDHENEVVNKNSEHGQRVKSSKRPYRRSLISSKKQKNKNSLKCVRCCSENECGSVFYNEGFQRAIDPYEEKDDDSSCASWNPPDVPYFSPGSFKNGVYDFTSLKRKKVDDTEASLDVSRIPISIRNSMVEHTDSHPFCLERSYVEL